jgi:prolyl-tRNA editing enzyme YbaK/EbsC (Cys-tRNA(Pro) deacylase)
VSQADFAGIQRVVDAAARKGVELDIRSLDAPVRGVEAASAAVGADLGHVVQSVVFVAVQIGGRLAPIVCLVSGRNAVDTRLLAAVVGETAVRRSTAAEIRELTGYSAGSVPPFGLDRGVRVVMDQELGLCEWLWAFAGSDAAMLRVSPGVLRMLSNAFVTPLAAAPFVAPVATQASPGSLDSRLRLEASSQA